MGVFKVQNCFECTRFLKRGDHLKSFNLGPEWRPKAKRFGI